jgi:hypothetical protein
MFPEYFIISSEVAFLLTVGIFVAVILWKLVPPKQVVFENPRPSTLPPTGRDLPLGAWGKVRAIPSRSAGMSTFLPENGGPFIMRASVMVLDPKAFVYTPVPSVALGRRWFTCTNPNCPGITGEGPTCWEAYASFWDKFHVEEEPKSVKDLV